MFHKRQKITIRPCRTLPDSAGLPPGLYSTRPNNQTHSSLGKANCAAPAHPRTISLYSSSAHNNVSGLICESTHRTLPTQLHVDHTIKQHKFRVINLITINNASLSHNSTHVRLLQERTLNNPDLPRHYTRPPPVKAAISHGDSRDSQNDTESLPTNCFVHNIESTSPTNIRCIPSHVYDRYTIIVACKHS